MRGRAGLAAGLAALAAAVMAAGRAPTAETGSPSIATVGPLAISREDFERRAEVGRAEYTRRKGSELPPEFTVLLERQALEGLIRANLLVLEAERQGISVPDAEAEVRIKADPFFRKGETVDEAKFAAFKASQPEAYREALRNAKREMAGRRLNDRIRQRFLPEEAAVRATALRLLTRARVEYLAVTNDEFSGDHPEPRETDVLVYYATHRDEFRRPARAVLSAVRIDEDEAPGGARQTADSALAAIREGATLESVGEEFGGVERDIVVVPGNLPGAWRPGAEAAARIFRLPPETVLPEPIPTTTGWLLLRVDQIRPAGVAPLREVSRDIRARLREDIRLHHEERELRAVYEAHRAEFAGFAYRLRYAVADARAIDPGKPSDADLDRYYRSHLADYTTYDASRGAIVSRPLAEVRDEIADRWRDDQRIIRARSIAERLERSWSAGRRDRALERSVATLREVGPLPVGAVVDTGLAGQILSETLARRGVVSGVGTAPFENGMIVFHVHDTTSRYTPTFEQIAPVLAERRRAEREQEEERAARELFERDPGRFAAGTVLHFTRVAVAPPSILAVPLTRKEVERYHRENIDRYSAPEMISARHILASPRGPGERADQAARRKAEDLLRRVRAGEDFAALATAHSDDPPTRDHGGDLGYFARGAMLDAFERAAFALKPGEVSDLVKTEVGYHIIKVFDHLPMIAEPLDHVYANVGADAALDKARRIAKERADSLYHVARTPERALAAARKLGLEVLVYRHVVGSVDTYPLELRASMRKLEATPPGQLYPGVVCLKGGECVLQWPDSVTARRTPTWAEVGWEVIRDYRRDAWRRALEAKRAELDSLLAAGWSFDSLGALWGGLRESELAPGKGLDELGAADLVDSLVFGGRRGRGLAEGDVGGWIETAAGIARIRVDERIEPSAGRLAARVESERRAALEHRLYDYFENLKRSFRVRILDPRLGEIALPPPPEPSL